MPTKHPPARKPVVVFVPGLGATGETYQPFLERLRGHFTVRVAMHPLKFPEKLDWPFFFRSINRMIGDDTSVLLLGHSMGGTIALAYAAQHPDRIRKVVAASPVLFPFKRQHPSHIPRSLWLSLQGAGFRHLARAGRIRTEVLHGDHRAKLYDWVGQVDLTSELPKLRQAVILWPEHEEVIPWRHRKRLENLVKPEIRSMPGYHNNLALHPKPLLPIIQEALRD